MYGSSVHERVPRRQIQSRGLRTLRTLDTSDPRQFGTMSLVPKCLTFFCRCRSVFGTLRHQCRTVTTFYEGAEMSQRTLRHWCRSVSNRSAARSCSCIASPPHVISAPSIVIFRLLLKTFLYIRNHTRHSNMTHNSFQ